tara:strand:+ start:4830 stop:5006 length:177 start_codon:yes stop_codon:yes gene_type:complete
MKEKVHKCEKCDDLGYNRNAIAQFCGTWVCEWHLEKMKDEGAYSHMMVKILSEPWEYY